METRYYPVDPSRWVEVQPFDEENPFGGKAVTPLDDQFLLQLFKRYGVEFPEGASLVYKPQVAQLVAVNTPENLENIERIISKSGPDFQQIYIDVWAVSFPSNVPQKLERKLGRPLRDKEYFDLWKKGEGKRTFSQGVRTISGVNAIIETGNASNPDGINDFVLNVTPTVGTHGVINLVLLPAHTIPKHQKKVVKNEEISWGLTTSVALLNEDAIVLGYSANRDGSQRIVIFLSARTARVLWKNKN